MGHLKERVSMLSPLSCLLLMVTQFSLCGAFLSKATFVCV